MNIDPRIYSDYRMAKRAAGELAIAMRFELLQSSAGKPQVRTTTGRVKTFPTWLAAWSWLLAVYRDRAPKVTAVPDQARPPPMARRAGEIPMAILLDD